MFSHRSSGTNIFVFKCKSRSRAIDWIWPLWLVYKPGTEMDSSALRLQLGGELPDNVDIHAPLVGSRVRLDLPNEDDDPIESLTPDYVIGACRSTLGSVAGWGQLMDAALRQGMKLGLAWRRELKLDWVWLPTDVDGRRRTWAVLCGLALRQPSVPMTLEIRMAQHFPTRLVLRDGRTLVEPAAVEGYLQHIHHKTGARTRMYVSTHDGNVYTTTSPKAHPPAPPAPGPPEPVLVDVPVNPE